MKTQAVSIRIWIRSRERHSKTHKTQLSHLQTMVWPIILLSKRVNICWITNHPCILCPLCLSTSVVSLQRTSFRTSFSLAGEIKTNMTQPWVWGKELTILAATEWSLVVVLVTAGILNTISP
jgi:hypothetical protein